LPENRYGSLTDKNVLVTGASGYIAGLLIPRLLESGCRVRCMVRDPRKIAHQPWADRVEVVYGDVSRPETLAPALQQVETAYYLIHNMSYGRGYQVIERHSAQNFSQAAHSAGVAHIIYLGGLVDPEAEIAPHMRSRIETGEVLRSGPVPVTELRAGVIVGPGSISFEMIRFICEQFPIVIGPNWLHNYTQPIFAENVVDYLVAALKNPNGRGQIIEIGGPDVYTYAETLMIYGQARDLQRWLITFPFLPAAFMAFVVDKLTPIPAAIAHPLIGGLHSSSMVTDPKARWIFPEVELVGYHQALEKSLAWLHPDHLEPLWRRRECPYQFIMSEGFLIETREFSLDLPLENALPRLDLWIDRRFPASSVRKALQNSSILVEERQDSLGCCWSEWELRSISPSETILRQTGYFAPRGLTGFLSSWMWRRRQKRVYRQILRFLAAL
jgi:uncharacterized protein YbjT (DUF2867 family)